MNRVQTAASLLPIRYLGRFKMLRDIYSFIMSFRRCNTLTFHQNNIESVGSQIKKRYSTYFDTALIAECVADLRAKAISPRLRLPDSAVDGVIDYARSVPFRDLDGRSTFMMSDIDNALSNVDISGLRGICSDVSTSEHIMKLVSDYVLCQIATQYLGYEPSTVEVYMEILLASRAVEQSGDYAPFEYHYDVPGLNFIGFFFYLSDVDDVTGGAHAMIMNSNHDKPLRYKLQSARSAGKAGIRVLQPRIRTLGLRAKRHGICGGSLRLSQGKSP